MRRISAMLLVALFSFSLIGQAVFATGADSNLPSCCRRTGSHHCSTMGSSMGSTMAIQADPSTGPSLQAARCVAFPVVRAIPFNRTVGLPVVFRVFSASTENRLAFRPQEQSLGRISYSRADQKRGPPSLLT
jgi:hypothetical protein